MMADKRPLRHLTPGFYYQCDMCNDVQDAYGKVVAQPGRQITDLAEVLSPEDMARYGIDPANSGNMSHGGVCKGQCHDARDLRDALDNENRLKAGNRPPDETPEELRAKIKHVEQKKYRLRRRMRERGNAS